MIWHTWCNMERCLQQFLFPKDQQRSLHKINDKESTSWIIRDYALFYALFRCSWTIFISCKASSSVFCHASLFLTKIGQRSLILLNWLRTISGNSNCVDDADWKVLSPSRWRFPDSNARSITKRCLFNLFLKV